MSYLVYSADSYRTKGVAHNVQGTVSEVYSLFWDVTYQPSNESLYGSIAVILSGDSHVSYSFQFRTPHQVYFGLYKDGFVMSETYFAYDEFSKVAGNIVRAHNLPVSVISDVKAELEDFIYYCQGW